jgi:transcriptional regulator NrdR family protein
VKINIFETFRTLIKSSILQEQHQSVETQLAMAPSLERQRSSVDEINKLVPYIVSELVKQLKESKSQRVKAGVMHTLAACSHALGQKLTGLFD